MATNPFEEIKKIMELREMGAISESEAAEMLAIVEQQYQPKNESEISAEKPKSFTDDDEPIKLSEEPDEFIIEIQEEKPKVFGDDDEKKSSSDHRNEKPKNFDFDEPKINKYSNESKTIISNKFVYLIAGFGLIFICSFFTAVPAIIWDADEDGYHTYLDDECPDVIGTINGCPDQDKDGVPDQLDSCPTEKGFNNGCPTDSSQTSTDSNQIDISPQKETDKLLNGRAVKVPKDSPLIKFTGQHWIRFKNINYEVSNFENKGYQPVKSQETVDALNKYYGLNGVLKQVPTPSLKQTNTNPQEAATPNPFQKTKPSSKSKGLTQTEEMELKNLLEKEKTTPLNSMEKARKKQLWHYKNAENQKKENETPIPQTKKKNPATNQPSKSVSKGLTASEEKELNYLLQKHETTILTNEEYRRKIALLKKKGNH